MPGIVFVTAFLDLREDRSKDKSVVTCFNHFTSLAKTGANIHLSLSRCYQNTYETICKDYPNVIVEYLELSDLQTYKEIADIDVRLPDIRTGYHDTRAFLTLMNSKAELLARATKNPLLRASHYAWIDFSIFHVFKHPERTTEYLRMLSGTRLRENCMLVAGCWPNRGINGDSIFQRVNWRFCGGFLVGSVARIIELDLIYRNHFRSIVIEKGLTWEVNMMAFFENTYGWSPEWFQGGHDDTIVVIPPHSIPVVASLTTIPSRTRNCISTIDSLLPQVDHIYLSVCKKYTRFSESWETPDILYKEPYASKVTVVFSEDFGPATKYLGAIHNIPEYTWTFICDDDQVYHPTLLNRMLPSVQSSAVYQNHYEHIKRKTSGGVIHGYVGLLINSAHIAKLGAFPLPEVARFVDDQWMSIYCYMNKLPIIGTSVEEYKDIFAVLQGWHEQIGPDSLASLNNRGTMVNAIAEFFRVQFIGGEVFPID